MARYTFSATDLHGNVIEGAVSANDIASAAEQVRRMGYTPIRVELAEAGETASVAHVGGASAAHGSQRYAGGFSVASSVSSVVPPVMDLTQVYSDPASPDSGPSPASIYYSDAPSPAYTLNSLVGIEDAGVPVAHAPGRRLEPWERSIGLGATAPGQEIAPTETSSVAPVGIERPAIPGAYGGTSPVPAGGTNVTGTGNSLAPGDNPHAAMGPRRPVPYGAGFEPEKTLQHRFMERIVYPISSGVVLKDLAPFLRQFATLISAGLPLFQALVALDSNTKNAKLKEIARESQRQVQAGGRLSDAWAAYPWIFTPMQIAMLRAAEQGGMLESTLRNLADYIEHDLEVKRTINQQTLYPKLTLFIAIMILGKNGFFGGMPAVSALIVGGMGRSSYTMGDYLGDTFGFMLLGLVPLTAAFIAYRLFFFNVTQVREGVDSLKISLPVVGKVTQYLATARFARNYAALSRSGFTAASALPIAGEASGNAVMRNVALRAVPATERGSLVSTELARSTVFPHMAIDMLRTGETSGSMDQMMDKVADFHEAEGKSKAFQFAMIFGVAVFLLLAVIVGFSIIQQWMGMGAASTRVPTE